MSGGSVRRHIAAITITEWEDSAQEERRVCGVSCLRQRKGDTETGEIGELKNQ